MHCTIVMQTEMLTLLDLFLLCGHRDTVLQNMGQSASAISSLRDKSFDCQRQDNPVFYRTVGNRTSASCLFFVYSFFFFLFLFEMSAWFTFVSLPHTPVMTQCCCWAEVA